MYFGISLSPAGWVMAFFIALTLIFAPIFAISAVAELFSEPLTTIINILGAYILAPALVCYLYNRKMRNSGRGSMIFWIYCGFYVLFFVISITQLFSKDFSLETIAAPIVSGAVSFFMITFAYKSKSKLKEDLDSQYELEREDEIKRQAEAILLAEKIKEEQTQT